MIIKKTLALLLVLVQLLCITACSLDKGPQTVDKTESYVGTESSNPEEPVVSNPNEPVESNPDEPVVSNSDEPVDFEGLWDSLINGDSDDVKYTNEEIITGQYSIVTGESARVASAKINNKNAKDLGKLNIEKTIIYGYDNDWSFNHAPFITYFNGEFIVYWMQGRANEDDLGQRLVMSTSKDFKNWKTSIFSDSMDGVLKKEAQAVQWPQGFFCFGDKLVAFYSASEYNLASLRDNGTLRPLKYDFALSYRFYKTFSPKSGWSEPIKTKISGGGNMSAIKLNSGRYAFAKSTGISYSDDPSGLGAWIDAGLDSKQKQDAEARGAKNLCESSLYQTKDNVLHLLMRSDTPVLWHTQSTDNGATWSNAYPTCFSNDSSKFQSGVLPNGKFFIVSNPVVGSERQYLKISISDDGYNFNREYIIRDEVYKISKPGLDKGGNYGYPTCLIVGDWFYTVYSVGKEIIEISRFKVSDLK